MIHANTPTPDSLAHEPAERKRLTTLQARAALAGFALTFFEVSRCHFYMAARWDHSRTFDSLDEVEGWLSRAVAA